MKAITWWVAPAIAAGLLFGCAAETGPDGSGAALVRKADYEGRILFLDPVVSPAPLTAEQMGDTTFATPVEVRFYEDYAVAWRVVDGVAQTGDAGLAVAAWAIEEHVAISDDVSRDDAPPSTTEATPEQSITDVGIGTGFDTDTFSTPNDDFHQDWRGMPFARLEWLRDAIDEWQYAPPAYHPGCI